MKPAAVNAILVTLNEMWPGELGDEAVAVWSDKLAAFDDTDPNVRIALEACVEICKFRPTFAEFAEAYSAAQRATPQPRRHRAIGTAETYCRECGGPYWSEANNMSKPHYPVCSSNRYGDSDKVLGANAAQYERVYGHKYVPEQPMEPVTFEGNPVTRMKEMLAKATLKSSKATHTFAKGQHVVVDRPGFGGTDPLNGKEGQYVGMSPDNEWLRIDLEGSVRLFKPSQLKAVTS